MTNATSLFWFSVCANGAGDRYFKSRPQRDDRIVRCFYDADNDSCGSCLDELFYDVVNDSPGNARKVMTHKIELSYQNLVLRET